jgi:hypothetical protein
MSVMMLRGTRVREGGTRVQAAAFKRKRAVICAEQGCCVPRDVESERLRKRGVAARAAPKRTAVACTATR